MKGLKHTMLALGIAGVPAMAMADFQALDDSVMGNITGQAVNVDGGIYMN